MTTDPSHECARARPAPRPSLGPWRGRGPGHQEEQLLPGDPPPPRQQGQHRDQRQGAEVTLHVHTRMSPVPYTLSLLPDNHPV